MASVVTLMPPAVEAEPPPTNMSMSVTEQARAVDRAMSTSRSRPISPSTEMKKALQRPDRPILRASVAGLLNSRTQYGDRAEHEQHERRDEGELHVQRPARGRSRAMRHST